ncbi:aspartate aminotransferase family protein [Aliiroseovarius sp. 2305UL8-7]|uniref:aspartate aminotransferase family protein n=1 Tax=Aliiroseovarius conchicola TaxID=3121637 RepID=UPI00352991C6
MKTDNFIKENNARQFWQPMTHPAEAQKSPPKIIVGGSGVRIKDIDGAEAIDAVGGLWNVNLGYSNDAVKSAITRQLDSLPYYSTFRGTTNDAAIELAYELCEFFKPEGIVRVFYTSGGSDSVETSLRLARQYHKLRGEPGRTKYLSLKKGYHGTHTGGASVNGNNKFRTAYEPLLPGCFHTPAPYTYRNPFNETDPAKLSKLCIAALEDEIKFQDPSTIAAFIMEPILGAGGVIPPHESFMPAVREICDRYGILLISDEVITAFGRTGAWSGSRLWGVQPDMMSTAKAITNGYFPFGAVLINEKMAEVFEGDTSGMGAISHGYTYSGHPVGAAAAIECLKETVRIDVASNAAARGAELFAGLKALGEKHEAIGDVRGGHGLMAAVEGVSDRATKAPASGAAMAKVFDTAYEAGVMLRVSGNNIILSPPLVVTADDVAQILSAIDQGFSAL